MSPPYRLSNFEIVYGLGIDKYKEIMELGNEFEILRKYGKTITYAEVKYPIDQFEELLSDNPEFYDSIKQDIINKIKQVELPIEEVVEDDIIEDLS
jgi:recombination protein RecA